MTVHAWHKKWAPDSASDFSNVATIPDEHNGAEVELLDLVAQLELQRHIIGKPLTLEELLDPAEEHEIGEHLDGVDSGDMEIVSMMQVKARDNIEEVDSDLRRTTPKWSLHCSRK